MSNSDATTVILFGAIFALLCFLSIWRERALEAERKLAELQNNEEGTWKDQW